MLKELPLWMDTIHRYDLANDFDLVYENEIIGILEILPLFTI
jgi:hypothetical protein